MLNPSTSNAFLSRAWASLLSTQNVCTSWADIPPLKRAALQKERFGNAARFNGGMSAQEVQTFCVLSNDAQALLKKAFDVLGLSMRGYHKILKVARTIAD